MLFGIPRRDSERVRPLAFSQVQPLSHNPNPNFRVLPERMALTRMALPVIRENFIFSVGATSLIDAPREKVWGIITDFKSYKHWSVSYLFGANEKKQTTES